MCERPILIAGCGPVGAIAALMLAREGFEVLVFEADQYTNEAPRAATAHPATLEMLADLNLIDAVIERGLRAPIFQFWDRRSARMIAEFNHSAIKEDTDYPFVIQCEQHKLTNIAIERLRAFPNVTVERGKQISSVDLFDDRVVVHVQAVGRRQSFAGSYLIGADGGRSTVRKQLGIAFNGYTFPERFLIVTTTFDFAQQLGCAFRSFFSDPDEWTNLFKVPGDDNRGAWRVLFPTRLGETDEDALSDESIQSRLQRFCARPGLYPIVHRNLYHVHQRVADTFQKGRVFLVGDAAHINNPLGGLGLNCGIHDAVDLTNRLLRVLRHEEPMATLDGYDHSRRPINLEFVQKQSVENKKRLEEKDEGVREANFDYLRRTAADPKSHRAFLLRASLLESVR